MSIQYPGLSLFMVEIYRLVVFMSSGVVSSWLSGYSDTDNQIVGLNSSILNIYLFDTVQRLKDITLGWEGQGK